MKNIFQRIHKFPKEYLTEIEGVYDDCRSIDNISRWLRKFDSLSRAVENGKGTYRQVENYVFELKVINYIYNISPNSHITYEPFGNKKQGKDCDLLVKAKRTYLIELKSFHPETREDPIPYEYVTKNNELIMDGYAYHDYQAVRGHLIDAAYETEDKMANYDGNYVNVMGVLLGFYLHLEDLRDFVTIYRTGKFRVDDPLGKMTMYNLKRKFTGSIEEFWGFPFDQLGFEFKQGKTAVRVSRSQSDDEKLNVFLSACTNRWS